MNWGMQAFQEHTAKTQSRTAETMKTQILFVDDERNVLDGLQRMLRVFHDEWEMHFALSGPEALAIMAAKPIDIIVADMRMPEMNGAQLLTEVMRRHPGTIRIVLSGHAGQDLIMRSVGVAHQYLSKPCDPETFKSTVMRATQLRALLDNANLQRLVSELGTLPSPPMMYYELADELRSPEASIQKVAQIVSRDPAMTAKVLQLANSALFSRLREVSNPREAVSYLGLERIQHLFLSLHAFSHFESAKWGGLSIDRVWEHSMATAALSKRISESARADKWVTDASFTAGLLHDIGKLTLASRLPNRYRKAASRAQTNGVPQWQAERELMGASHAEVGAYLLALWGIPNPIVEAVAFHHHPSQSLGRTISPVTMVHVANALDHAREAGNVESVPGLDGEYLARLALTDNVGIWQRQSRELFQQGVPE